MHMFNCLTSLFRLIKPFECYHANIKQSSCIDKEKPSLIDSICNVSTKIYEYFPSQASCSKSCKSFLDKKKIVLKNGYCRTAQSVKKVALCLFRKSIDILKKVDPFSYDIEPIKIVEIKRYHLRIYIPSADESKYFEIKSNYENYIKNTPYPILKTKNIFFDDALHQILLTTTLEEFEKINDIDPISKKPIIDIDYGMEIEYKLFGEIVEIKNI